MPTPATHAPHRPRLSSVIGAAFVGSTLIAVMSPAHADPADPVASAVITFSSEADSVELGEAAPPNTLSVTNTGDIPICLLELRTDSEELPAGAPIASVIAPEITTQSTVTGAPRQDTTVTATLRYAAAPGEGCQGVDESQVKEVASNPWTVTVTDPEPSPSPTPTESPSETPTEEPTEQPTRTPSPSPTPSPTNSESPTPTPPPSGTPTPSPSASESSAGGGSGNERGPARTPNQPPRSTVSTAPTSGASIPTLPRNEADLPDLSPGEAEDLAELPLVTPTADEDTETEVAADHSDMGPSIAPAVLLAAFLLALLLATPLAPTRRVRLGGGYQGRRRKV
jgi:hypothetical protein